MKCATERCKQASYEGVSKLPLCRQENAEILTAVAPRLRREAYRTLPAEKAERPRLNGSSGSW